MEDRDINWTDQLEDLIGQEGEKCRGLAWIHQKAEQDTSRKNTAIQIPVIVLSTLAGTASVGSSSLFVGSSSDYSNILIGFVSIAVGVLNTIGSYFAFARKSEAHRIAHLHYSKLFSWVSIELALPRNERMSPESMLKQLRETMDRLAETTPSVPPEILKQFNEEFKNEDVAKPAETNGLARIKIFRNNGKTLTSTRSQVQLVTNPLHGLDTPTPTQRETKVTIRVPEESVPHSTVKVRQIAPSEDDE